MMKKTRDKSENEFSHSHARSASRDSDNIHFCGSRKIKREGKVSLSRENEVKRGCDTFSSRGVGAVIMQKAKYSKNILQSLMKTNFVIAINKTKR